MSLLLVFFVLLASYSTVDVVKYRSMVGSLQEAFGSRDRTLDDARLYSSPTRGIASAAEEQERRWVENEVEALVEEVGGPLQMQETAEGLRLRVEGQVLFGLGEAELRADAYPLFRRLSPILKRYPYRIFVEGHTDNLPIQNPIFPSNWELSAARAARVVRYFITEGKLETDRLVAVGFADTHPVAPNTDDESRRKNRRVEFLLSTSPKKEAEPVPVPIPELIQPFSLAPPG